jgi:hypothetical protein
MGSQERVGKGTYDYSYTICHHFIVKCIVILNFVNLIFIIYLFEIRSDKIMAAWKLYLAFSLMVVTIELLAVSV